MNEENYYVLDDTVNSYLPLDWDKELPDFEIDEFGASYPPENLLLNQYTVKAKVYKLEEDYRICESIASDDIINICLRQNIPFVSAKLDMILYRNKIPSKKYNYFYPKDRVQLMDLSKSTYTFSKFVSKDGKCMEESIDHFDAIDQFVVKNGISSKLFYCTEICAFVCASSFKDEYESQNLTGVSFIPIDENYKYDPWRNW